MGVERSYTMIASCDECGKQEDVSMTGRVPVEWRYLTLGAESGATEGLVCTKDCAAVWAVKVITEVFK